MSGCCVGAGCGMEEEEAAALQLPKEHAAALPDWLQTFEGEFLPLLPSPAIKLSLRVQIHHRDDSNSASTV